MSREFSVTESGLITRLDWDDDGLTLTHLKDENLIKRDLKALHEAAENRNRNAQMRWVGRVDEVIYMGWQQEWKEKHRDTPWSKFLISKLNSSDYNKLRTEKL
ncbi:MAG: hypothetical protein EP323_00435 [Gammaproteobacteria bacterium]|nr:MAG: hypothetical protein EP323_00435 [Gammaproteobacteria bacterium]